MTTGKGIVVIRVLALCSAVGLGGGYVWTRQKAAMAAEQQRVNSAAEPADAAEKRSVMPGSKSFVVQPQSRLVDQEWFQKVPNPDPQESKKRVVLPGSKTGEVIVLPPEADPPKERAVLPGSKSIDRILQPPAPEEEP